MRNFLKAAIIGSVVYFVIGGIIVYLIELSALAGLSGRPSTSLETVEQANAIWAYGIFSYPAISSILFKPETKPPRISQTPTSQEQLAYDKALTEYYKSVHESSSRKIWIFCAWLFIVSICSGLAWTLLSAFNSKKTEQGAAANP